MRLKIKSDGYPHGTTVEDEDGRRIQNVERIEWTIDSKGHCCAVLYVRNVKLESETPGVVVPIAR